MTVSAFLDYFSLSRWLADTILVHAGWVVSEAPLALSPSARRDCETRNCARLSESFATSLPPGHAERCVDIILSLTWYAPAGQSYSDKRFLCLALSVLSSGTRNEIDFDGT